MLPLIFLLLRHWFDVVWLQSSQLLSFRSEKALVPDDHIIELLLCDDDIVKLLECLMLLVHHAQNVETVSLDLLNEVSVKRECLKLR